MKAQLSRIGCIALMITAVVTGNHQAQAQSNVYNTFTYQGRLDDFGPGIGDDPRNMDFLISLISPPAPCFGTDCGWFTNCNGCVTTVLGTNSVIINQGLFTIPINMPTGMLQNVNGLYLQFAVRTNGGGEFTALWPAQALTATPYAAVAQSVSGPVDASSLTGQMPTGLLTGIFSSPLRLVNQGNVFGGDGSLLANVNATTLGGFAACDLPCFWKLTGNAGTDPNVNFLGTTDNKTVVFRANNEVVMRYQPHPNGPSIIGGHPDNVILSGAGGAVIAGGGAALLPNQIWNDGSAIGGGIANYIRGRECFIGGGWGNFIDDFDLFSTHYAAIGGGSNNYVNVDFGFIGGGVNNRVSGESSVVTGGQNNSVTAFYSTISGGIGNTNTAHYATIGGGIQNLTTGQDAVVAGGSGNSATAGQSTVGGGLGNRATASQSTVGGGVVNSASGVSATIAGGELNTNATTYGTIGGGALNRVSGPYSGTIAGGYQNTVLGQDATIGGGSYHLITSNHIASTIAGGQYNGILTDDSVAPADYRLPNAGSIGGGISNRIIGALYGTIGGGVNNLLNNAYDFGPGWFASDYATVGGGANNVAYQSIAGVVAGGKGNRVEANYATVSGGATNVARFFAATVSGGQGNIADGTYSVVAGGLRNTAGINGVVAGGVGNTAGSLGTVLGGSTNRAAGQYSVALGADALAPEGMVQGAGRFAAVGDAQAGQYLVKGSTTNATVTTLGGSLLAIPLNAGWSFDILVTARGLSSTAAGYQIKGMIQNLGGTTGFVGVPTVTLLGETNPALDVAVEANNAVDRLLVKVTGLPGEWIYWVASVRTVEVIH